MVDTKADEREDDEEDDDDDRDRVVGFRHLVRSIRCLLLAYFMVEEDALEVLAD